MSFEEAFEQTLALEGGLSDDPGDPGGLTKYGISKRAYPDVDIANLTVDQAKAIYLRDYWDALGLDSIEDPAIAAEVFDSAVNCGRFAAVRFLQQAIAYLGEPVIVDGKMGPQTIGLANKWSRKDPRALFVAMNGYQFAHYASLSTSKRFGRGWTKRVQEYREGA